MAKSPSPIILPGVDVPPDKTKYIDIGGGIVGILYPEVYFRFVVKLYNQHDDLIQGMAQAQVKLSDGSAFDYLNLMLGTEVNKSTPMEVGYAQLYDALDRRVTNKITQQRIKQTAEAFKEHQMWNTHEGKLFPEVPDQ